MSYSDYPVQEQPRSNGPLDTLLAAGRMPVQLRRYWERAEPWGQPGAFRKCVRDLLDHGVPARMVNGACANLHKNATGKWPSEK